MHEHALLSFLLGLAILLGAARALGELGRSLERQAELAPGRVLSIVAVFARIGASVTQAIGSTRPSPASQTSPNCDRDEAAEARAKAAESPASQTSPNCDRAVVETEAVLVATWNVNGIRARSQRLAEFLAERKPDVVCLQELKITPEEFPHLELRAAGYHAVLAGQQGWNGVAVLAKEPPELILRELPGAAEHGARFVLAKTHGLEVASIYVPNGKTVSHADYRMKLGWLERLCEQIESRADKDAPLVLGGDFNVCWTDLDSYGGARFKGQIFHTDEERALMERLRAAGLVDLFRLRYPDDPGFSWWDYRAGAFHKKEGMRIDLLLATPSVASRVTDVYVERDFRKKGKTTGSAPSDHAPVVAILER